MKICLFWLAISFQTYMTFAISLSLETVVTLCTMNHIKHSIGIISFNHQNDYRWYMLFLPKFADEEIKTFEN